MYLKKKKQSDNEHNCELLFILTIVIGALFLCVWVLGFSQERIFTFISPRLIPT